MLSSVCLKTFLCILQSVPKHLVLCSCNRNANRDQQSSKERKQDTVTTEHGSFNMGCIEFETWFLETGLKKLKP